MNSIVLYAVLVLIPAAVLQFTSCQEDNSSLPVSFSSTVLEGGGQVCPSEEQVEMVITEIDTNILNTLRNDILCSGQVQGNPASSCLEVSQLSR